MKDDFEILKEKGHITEDKIVFKTLNGHYFIADVFFSHECFPEINEIIIITEKKIYQKDEALKYLIDNKFLRDIKGNSDLKKISLRHIKLLLLKTFDHDLVILTLYQDEPLKDFFYLLDCKIDEISSDLLSEENKR